VGDCLRQGYLLYGGELMKVNEVFLSFQGEGSHTGRVCTFVRFSGCNLKCPWCDTRHEEGSQMTPVELVGVINKESQSSPVVLTGGEPMIQPVEELVDLVLHLAAQGREIWVETNGVVPPPQELLDRCWFTVSPKNVAPFENGILTTRFTGEIKMLVSTQDVAGSAAIFSKIIRGMKETIADCPIFLQPIYVEGDTEATCTNVQLVMLLAKTLFPFKGKLGVSLQIHKYFGFK
jgi:7-carboxy-7-deazaguanine synthase